MTQERSGLSATDIDELIDRLFKNITLVPEADIWSEDGVFKHQDYANWYRTEDIIEHSNVEL